jgi:hypothetical protein
VKLEHSCSSTSSSFLFRDVSLNRWYEITYAGAKYNIAMRWMDGSWPASQDMPSSRAFVLYLVRGERANIFHSRRSLARKKLHESKLALSVINLVDETQPRHFCVFLAFRPAASDANCKRASVLVALCVINKRKNGLG